MIRLHNNPERITWGPSDSRALDLVTIEYPKKTVVFESSFINARRLADVAGLSDERPTDKGERMVWS